MQEPANPDNHLVGGPLNGVRVVDFAWYIPGPLCALHLAWLGADITSVEPPPAGDPLRTLPPYGANGESLAAASVLRGKRWEILDLTTQDGQSAAHALCDQADVVIEGYRPSVADRLGIGFEELHGRNGRLVYCSISGYGQDGPWSDRPGHDLNYLASNGLLDLLGTPEAPRVPGLPFADTAGAQTAATAICAALVARERTGRGCHIDISIAEAALAFGTHLMPAASAGLERRAGGLLSGGFGCYNTYRCADGRFVAIGAVEPHFFSNLCTSLGCPELIELQWDPDRQGEVISGLSRRLATRTALEWSAELEEGQSCLSLVRHTSEAGTLPPFHERRSTISLWGDDRYRAPASPYVIDGQRTAEPLAVDVGAPARQ